MPGKRYSIYDMMEERGVFAANPANVASHDKDGQPLYVGPVAYPKMLYHPKGEQYQSNPPEILATPLGAQVVNERWDLISVVVNTPEEEERLRAQGWHDHPAKSIEAAHDPKRPVPPIGIANRVNELEEEIRRLRAEKAAEAREAPLGGRSPRRPAESHPT